MTSELLTAVPVNSWCSKQLRVCMAQKGCRVLMPLPLGITFRAMSNELQVSKNHKREQISLLVMGLWLKNQYDEYKANESEGLCTSFMSTHKRYLCHWNLLFLQVTGGGGGSGVCVCVRVCVCAHVCVLSHVQLFATLWTEACQTPLSMESSRQEYWSGLPFPPPEYLPNPGIKPMSLTSPALAGRFFTAESPGKP